MAAGRMMTHYVGDTCAGGHRDDRSVTLDARPTLTLPACCLEHGVRVECVDATIILVHNDDRKTIPLDPQIMFSGVSLEAAVQRELDLFITACHEYDDGEDER